MSDTENKEKINLSNVDYDDVLHLYRGWRKSENALRTKNKELNELKARVKQLHDSHIKFRSQIQALEAVKELTVSLQTQLSVLTEENNRLSTENRELCELNTQAESLLRERMEVENQQSKALRNIQVDFATLRGRYEEISSSQRDLEALAADEQAMRMSCEARLDQAENTAENLRNENTALRIQLDATTLRMNQCDNELAHASEQLSSLGREIAHISAAGEAFSASQAEIGVLKGDIARLLRLLEHYPAAKGFIVRWQDSEGMSFVGVPHKDSGSPSRTRARLPRDSISPTRGRSSIDFEDTLRTSRSTLPVIEDDINDTEGWLRAGISPAELNNLRRTHNGDPFPMSDDFALEIDNWVPTDAAREGLKFLHAKIPHAPPNVIMDFLRKMNKIWMAREKRKIKAVSENYEKQITELKRKVANSRPFEEVITKKTIKRLKNQVKEERSKHLHGKAKKFDIDLSFQADDDMGDLPPHERRICMQHGPHYSKKKGGNLEAVSAEKLLEASLISLETIGRQKLMNKDKNENKEINMEDGYEPSDEYLRGALWLGQNITIVVEELADAMDYFASKHMAEVSAAANDNDVQRSSHRLNLLAGSGITEAIALTNRSKMRSREILQSVFSLRPGDTRSYLNILSTLPLDSAFAMTNSPKYSPAPSPKNMSRSNSPLKFSSSSPSASRNTPLTSRSR